MKNIHKILIIFTSLILLIPIGCTDLEEEVYEQLLVDNYGKTEDEVNSLVGPIWSELINYPNQYLLFFNIADMGILPTRKGGDWWDGGVYKEFRLHTWTPSNRRIQLVYENLMARVTRCNQILNMVETSEGITDKEPYIAQVRAARAFWYYVLIDNWGNVPLVTDFTDMTLPSTTARAEVYQFVLDELNDIKGIIRADVSSSSYGKFTKGAVYTMLAKMYLNAEVWNPTGGPKWQEAIDACDEVLALPYSLQSYWPDLFKVHNEDSKECILAAVYSTSASRGVAGHTLHYLDPKALGLNIVGRNGLSAMPGFIKAFDTEDKRLAWSFLIGPSLDPVTGDTLVTAHGRPLIHTVDITMKYNIDADGWGQAEQEDGARCFKWEIPKGLSTGLENDVFIFRLADVYLMKAEALVRLDQDNEEATRLVNEIRKRAFDDPAKLKNSVTLEDIYQERRFEFAWEMMERQDQIRFGTYLDPIPGWKEYTSNSRCLLLPIPTTALNANPNLTQNPGY